MKNNPKISKISKKQYLLDQFYMNLIPYSRYACTVLDCEKRPFLSEFLDEPDTPSCRHQVPPLVSNRAYIVPTGEVCHIPSAPSPSTSKPIWPFNICDPSHQKLLQKDIKDLLMMVRSTLKFWKISNSVIIVIHIGILMYCVKDSAVGV